MNVKYKIIYTERINGEQVAEKTIEFFYKSKMLSVYQSIIDTSKILLGDNMTIQEKESQSGRIFTMALYSENYSIIREYQMVIL